MNPQAVCGFAFSAEQDLDLLRCIGPQHPARIQLRLHLGAVPVGNPPDQPTFLAPAFVAQQSCALQPGQGQVGGAGLDTQQPHQILGGVEPRPERLKLKQRQDGLGSVHPP